MGYSCSFIAVKGREKAQVLRTLGLSETGKVLSNDWRSRPKRIGTELPGGWVLIWMNGYGRFKPRSLAAASKGAEVLGWQVEDHVMVSDAWGYRDGREVWAINYNCEKGEVETSGELPKVFASIHEDVRREQESYDEQGLDVDVIYEAPVRVAAALCGFRHDEAETDKLTFHVLQRTGSAEAAPSEKKGLLARLFGGG